MNWIGARWWKFDFHTHTPASFDYGRGDQNAKQITPREWLLSFINSGVQCVAVTDHNSGACAYTKSALVHEFLRFHIFRYAPKDAGSSPVTPTNL